jgi:hypothetical protein
MLNKANYFYRPAGLESSMLLMSLNIIR